MGKVYFDLRTLTFDLKNTTIRTIFHILDFIQVNNNFAEELVFHLQRLNILQIIKYFQIWRLRKIILERKYIVTESVTKVFCLHTQGSTNFWVQKFLQNAHFIYMWICFCWKPDSLFLFENFRKIPKIQNSRRFGICAWKTFSLYIKKDSEKFVRVQLMKIARPNSCAGNLCLGGVRLCLREPEFLARLFSVAAKRLHIIEWAPIDTTLLRQRLSAFYQRC